MRKQPPIARCFIALCFSSAVALIALEWRNPFPEPVTTPATLTGLEGQNIQIATGESTASTSLSTNEQTGWGFRNRAARATAAEALAVHLNIFLEGRYLEVRAEGKPTIRYEIAVGQDDWQTPTGSFAVMNMLENPAWQHPITKEEIPPGTENPLGDRWIGFWTDGQAQIGFHGTNQEDLIGEAVSHGCVRMRNRDIQNLYQRVDIGTPVTVHP